MATDLNTARTADLLALLNTARQGKGLDPLKVWKGSKAALLAALDRITPDQTVVTVGEGVANSKAPAKARKAKATKADRRERRRWAETEGLDRKAAKVLRAKLRKAAKAA